MSCTSWQAVEAWDTGVLERSIDALEVAARAAAGDAVAEVWAPVCPCLLAPVARGCRCKHCPDGLRVPQRQALCMQSEAQQLQRKAPMTH